MMPEQRLQLIESIRRRALSFGDFTLSSGKKSTYYMDMRLLSMTYHGQKRLGLLLAAAVLNFRPTVVSGMESGAIPLVCATVNALNERFSIECTGSFVRKGERTHGTKKVVEGCDIRPGDRVAVVEDVVSTAGSLIDAVKKIQMVTDVQIMAICIVDKLMGGGEKIQAECGIPLQSLLTVRDLGLD